MNTNSIKSFAKEARLLLLEGVAQRLLYWGFDTQGQNTQSMESIQGGFVFRGQVFTDTTIPKKWHGLKTRLTNKQAVLDVQEETAYTWFNRLMAIKILEQNGYIEPTLSYAEGTRTPAIVQQAKRGQHQLTLARDKKLLLEFLQEDQDELAFGLLITHLCHQNRVLHDVFGRIDDYTEILLPQNLLQKDGLLDLINSDAIAFDDYKEVELIGWLYQFYISDKKDEVFAGFKKNKKARAEDIPAATQIFTPKWIVKYMVENTVGKVYLDYEPTSSLKSEMKYLVVNDSDEIRSSSGVEKAIISDITELTLIDPASGSGHILVTGFELLFNMYREEGYTAKQAVDNILEHNLFGLDIDDRAMQLARFAVLLKAAQFDADVLNRGIIPHVYSFPEASHFTSEELQNFLGHEGHQFTAELREALQLLNQGKNIGSALKLELSDVAQSHIKKQYEDWLQKSKHAGLDIEQSSVWNRLQPFLDVLLVLTKKYASVVANPPYMGQKSMNGELKEYVNKAYPMTKSDLMTVFMEVIPNLTADLARFALINLPSWLFLSSFEKLREQYISDYRFDSLLHMGRGIFGIDFGSVAIAVQKTSSNDARGSYFKLHERNFQHIYYEDIEKLFLYSNNNEAYKYDFAQYRGDEGITEIPKQGTTKGLKLFYPNIPQTNFSKIPGSPIAYWVSERVIGLFNNSLIENYADLKEGTTTGDNNKYLKMWFEIKYKDIGFEQVSLRNSFKWLPYNKGGAYRKWYGNNIHLINWDNDGIEVRTEERSTVRNTQYCLLEGGTWSAISSGGLSMRYFGKGYIFDSKGPILVSREDNLLYLIGQLNSVSTNVFMSFFGATMDFRLGNLKKIPLLISRQSIVSRLVKDNIELSKNDWDSRESSWDFEKSPLLNESFSLSQAYLTWKEQVSNVFFQLHENEEELNRIFIDIYGLQEELTPEVALKDITILQEELDRNALEALEPTFREKGKEAITLPIDKAEVISQFLSYCVGVFMGRYRLDKTGLNIAHPNPSEEELAAYTYNGHPIEIDEDAILPLMGEDCAFPDDALLRIKDLVYKIWGEDSLTENLNFIQEALGMELHKWLTEKFWGYHTGMYKKKPIYWLFSSNPKKPQKAAFKVLVYMHRMDKYTVQKIQRNYLYPHQEYIKREIEKLAGNEENLSRTEMKRLEQFRNWELECRDYNEVLKELANQQIEFDLDDGVTVNYAKFEGAVAKI